MPDLVNPYAPPAAPPEARRGKKPRKRHLASLGKRFLGNLIDRALVFGGAAAMTYVLARAGVSHLVPSLILLELPLLALEWGLIVWRGQSIGKILVGTRIVRMNGAAPGLLHGVVLRAWPIVAISWAQLLPDSVKSLFVGLNVALLVDAAYIFAGKGARRCLHDMLADTCVVDVLRDRS